jgi:hypothetical protein
MASFDGAVPRLFTMARTRTKYVALGTPLTVRLVAGELRMNITMLVSPELEPASRM